MKKPKRNQSNKKQVEAFKKAARELECAEDEAAFDAALRQIAMLLGQTDQNADFGSAAWKKRHKIKD